MNIITKSDTKKFIALLKAGLKHGTRKEQRIYTSADVYDGTSVVKSYYVSLEMNFRVPTEFVEQIIADDLTENEIEELLG